MYVLLDIKTTSMSYCCHFEQTYQAALRSEVLTHRMIHLQVGMPSQQI